MNDQDHYPDRPIGGFLMRGEDALAPGGLVEFTRTLRAVVENDRLVRLRDEVDSARWQDSVAASTYAVARTRADLNRLLHYGHSIPLRKGYTRAFIEEHYPGWTWIGLYNSLDAAGVTRCGAGLPPYCDPGVGAVHFDDETSWLVEWEDGRVTRSDDGA